MARGALQRKDYLELGQSVGLELLDDVVPYTVYDKCNWKCVYCGKTYYKTYRALQARPNGCRCQNTMTLKDEDYKALAKRLGIQWLGFRPVNVHVETEWLNRRGEKVTFAYADLAYYVSKELKEKLGIPTFKESESPYVQRSNSTGT